MKHYVKSSWDPRSISAIDHDIEGHRIRTDAKPPFGDNSGCSPKRLLLASLSGCSAIDVISLLNKMRAPFDSFDMEMEADLTEEHPKTYSEIRLKYIFGGQNLKKDKIEKAVNLSLERYCGVTAMLESHCPIKSEIIYLEDEGEE